MKHFIIPGVLLLFFSTVNLTAQWVQVSNGMGNNVTVRSFAVNGINIFSGTSGYGVYLSTNSGLSWIRTSLDSQWVYSLALNSSMVFAGTLNGVFISTNNGSNWIQTSLNNRTIYSLAINGNNIFAGTADYGIYISSNNGSTWTYSGLAASYRNILAIAINGGNIFAGVSFLPHGGYYPPGVYLSQNNGGNWLPGGMINRFVYAFAVNGNKVFVGSIDGVFFSSNNDTNWQPSTLTNRTILSFAITGDTIFAGTSGNGVYVSINNGLSWTPRNEGLWNMSVRALCIVNDYIFAGTINSVYRRSLSELTVIKPITTEIPNTYSLSQNYPNPFNPVTKLRFGIPKGRSELRLVKLAIYDALGREVTTLVNEQLPQGTYEVEWNATDYPSGVYYYKLIAGVYSVSKKMILVK